MKPQVSILCLLIATIALSTNMGCRQQSSPAAAQGSTASQTHPTKTREAIERVLRKDQFTTFDTKSFSTIIQNMRQIDLDGCPTNFRTAYLKHIHAWESFRTWEMEAEVLVENLNSLSTLAESFIRGFVFDFSVPFEGNDKVQELQAKYIEIGKHVQDTLHKVEEIAIKHGAKLPPSRIIEWTGTCVQPGLGEYPMQVKMEVGPEGKIIGTIRWPELRDSLTSFSGNVVDETVTFTETELISGSGIGIPCKYDAKFDGKAMSGTARFREHTATFSITIDVGEPKILNGF